MTFLIDDHTDADAYTEIMRFMRQIRIDLTAARNRFAADGSGYRGLRGLFLNIERNLSELNILKSTQRLGQYAKDRQGDQGYDIVAEFNTMLTAYEAVQDSILTGLTAIEDGGGWYANEKLVKGVGRVDRSFTSGQLVDLIADIDIFLSTLG